MYKQQSKSLKRRKFSSSNHDNNIYITNQMFKLDKTKKFLSQNQSAKNNHIYVLIYLYLLKVPTNSAGFFSSRFTFPFLLLHQSLIAAIQFSSPIIRRNKADTRNATTENILSINHNDEKVVELIPSQAWTESDLIGSFCSWTWCK